MGHCPVRPVLLQIHDKGHIPKEHTLNEDWCDLLGKWTQVTSKSIAIVGRSKKGKERLNRDPRALQWQKSLP